VQPGDIRRALPADAPEHGEDFDAIFADFERLILPGVTHWNHPGFFAYFAISSSAPGVLAEFLAAALNQQAMLWRTSPAADGARGGRAPVAPAADSGCPMHSKGVIYDTASVSTLHALAAAREAAVPGVRAAGLAGRPDIKGVRVYCGEHAHTSVDKAVILLGLGHDAVERNYRGRGSSACGRSGWPRRSRVIARRAFCRSPLSRPSAARRAQASIRLTRSPRFCARERVWLHIDAAYAGVAAMVPGYEWILRGAGQADSLVLKPAQVALHAVRYLSVLYCRRMDVVRQAFALTPEYLKTSEGDAGVRIT